MFPLPSVISLCCSQISLLENTLLDWENRTLRNDYRHAQPLNGRVVESSFRAKLTQGKGSQQAGLRLSLGRVRKPMWKELSCKSLKLGMLEITFPRSSSVAVSLHSRWRWPTCLFAPCQHNLLLMVQWRLQVVCQHFVLTAMVSHRSPKISGTTWHYTRILGSDVSASIWVRYTNHCRNSSGMADEPGTIWR